MLSFFPLDVLDEIWDLIESVSEGFLNWKCISYLKNLSFECIHLNVCLKYHAHIEHHTASHACLFDGEPEQIAIVKKSFYL